jgi:hypothetical protein
VNREEFESSVIDLWVTTRIPLTRAHLQYHTGLGRQRLNRWLDELIGDGVLECEVDDSGEMLWVIPGAQRSTTGPRTFAELGRGGPAPGNHARAGANQAGLMREKDRRRSSARDDADEALASISRAALTLAGKSGVPAKKKKKGDDDHEKSLAVSAGLSLLGPIGWLYAGSVREAAIGTIAAVLLWKILPGILLGPLLYLGLPISVLAGLVYAWQYNRKGERTTLFLGKGDKDKGKEKDD